MRSILYTGLLFAAIYLVACAGESKSNLQELNLLSYGVPMSIQAPDSAKVKKSNFGVSEEISVRGEGNYQVDIYASMATTNDISVIKAEQLINVRDNRYFSKIISEEPQGFIFETKPDSTVTSYGFRYVKLQGDNEYIFQSGLGGIFSLSEVELMYNAVK